MSQGGGGTAMGRLEAASLQWFYGLEWIFRICPAGEK